MNKNMLFHRIGFNCNTCDKRTDGCRDTCVSYMSKILALSEITEKVIESEKAKTDFYTRRHNLTKYKKNGGKQIPKSFGKKGRSGNGR